MKTPRKEDRRNRKYIKGENSEESVVNVAKKIIYINSESDVKKKGVKI